MESHGVMAEYKVMRPELKPLALKIPNRSYGQPVM